MKKARAFYEGLLGLVPSDEFGEVNDESVYVEYRVGQATLALGNMDGWTPSKDGTCGAFETDTFEETLALLKEKGIEIVMDVQAYPNCKMAIVRDPDGNQVVLHQRNK